MTKELGKARGLTNAPLGVRSAVKKGMFAGDGIFHDTVDMETEENYVDYTQYVRLPHDGIKSQENLEKLSGKVKKFHISELPEEERKKYETKGKK